MEPVWDNREALGPRDAEPHQVVSHLVADRDEGACRMSQQPLDVAEDALPASAEIPAQNMTVIGVDNCPRPSSTGRDGGKPAGRSRLRGVCVQHVRVPTANDASQRNGGRRIGPGREGTLERGEFQNGDTQFVCDVFHRLLALRERSGDDHDLVPAPALLTGELEHMEGRAADVEARDHVDDRQRRRVVRHARTGLEARAGAAAATPRISQNVGW